MESLMLRAAAFVEANDFNRPEAIALAAELRAAAARAKGEHIAESMKYLLDHIDWKLLAEQKLALLEVTSDHSLCRDYQSLLGTIHLLDAFQDAAEAMSYPVVWLGDETGSLD